MVLVITITMHSVGGARDRIFNLNNNTVNELWTLNMIEKQIRCSDA